MNDAGLVVEIMWLSGAGWPGRDDRPALNELQWIQYQLDMHATTHDVIAAADQIRVAPIHGEVHYMVCDASAECASFEYLEGDLVIHHGDQLEIPALTNHTYDQSLAYARAREGVPASKGSGSLNRFHRAAEATVGVSSLETAWEVLKAVQWDRTQWQIVYEPEALTVHFKTRGNRKIRSISLKSMPTSCGSPVPVLSMQASLSGHVESSFVEFDPVANEALVQISVGELDATLPQGVVQAVSEISAHLMCAN
jgi:choloylglycine hydrolase